MTATSVTSLHFTPAYPPVTDGVAMVVLNYLRWMHRLGVGAHAVVPRATGWRAIDAHGAIPGIVRCASLPRPFARPYVHPIIGLGTRLQLRGIHADIVHIHYPIVMGWFGLRQARRRGIPVVMTFHTRYKEQIVRAVPWRFAADRIVRAVTQFYEAADEVWVPSAEAGDVLRGYGFRGPAIRVMGLATELPVPTDEEYERRRATGRLRLGLPAGRSDAIAVLLYLGNLIETKNVDLILDSLARLHAEGSRFAMVFAGEGYYRSTLERRTRELGIEHAVAFVGAVTDRERVKDLLAAANLLLFPSVADTAGIVRIEAAAYALPVVVVSEPCAAAGIEDGVNGFVSENDAGSYAQAVGNALADRDRLRVIGLAARRTLYRTWESRVSEAIQRYREIVETAPEADHDRP